MLYKNRNNQAERTIQIFKSHFKAALAMVDPNFPLSKWDRLIPQDNLTLNLLRSVRSNPKLSAYSYVYGTFNFMATLLALPRTKVVAHIHPDNRGLWELNGKVGWYVGPALNHYHCLEVYFLRTCETRYYDIVEFILYSISFPIVKLTNFLI